MRTSAMAWQIAARVADVLIRSGRENPELWWEAPKTIAVNPTASLDQMPLPLLIVDVNEVVPLDEGAVNMFRERVHVAVHMKTQGDNALRNILELVEDVRRAILRNRQLADAGGAVLVPSGQVFPGRYEVVTELAEGGAGQAFASHEFEVEHEWVPD